MVKQTIRIFCRIKPTKQQLGIFELEDDEDSNRSVLSFTIPRDLSEGLINNKKENYKFQFDKTFNQTAKQDEIFQNVAQPVIDNVISGFNGTIFAYGQTGSGKTFTITGGAERYVDRGIIPRTLSYIFQQVSNNSGYVFTIHVSYLEIYNESGFDLLDPKHEASKLEDLPKVSLLEDNDGNIHLKNLSMHQASNEEEALNLLFLGDTNRMIAETPMNQASTRSHCIFTIHIAVRETDSATIRRAKLHLVDLAGSERVSKTGVGGNLLKEAKYINLSLHFLEQVIIALSEKARNHIPYRNSMMTSVLRDSLGGNCMTSMIATCSVEKKNIDESISTCRFAQRVALIKNDAILNEELDPRLMIAKLKREIQQLKDELALATGQQYDSELTKDDKERLKVIVDDYMKDSDREANLSVGSDMRKINYCFHLLKKYSTDKKSSEDTNANGRSPKEKPQLPSPSSLPNLTSRTENNYLADTTELQKLKDLILQRDNEINILVSMLKKEKQRSGSGTTPHQINHQQQQKQQQRRSSQKQTMDQHDRPPQSRTSSSGRSDVPDEEFIKRSDENMNVNKMLRDKVNKNKGEMSLGRQEAFEMFKRDYPENALIEENKRGLKSRYTDAKKLGEQVNGAKSEINSLKTRLEKCKMRRSIQVAAGTVDVNSEDEEEMKIRSQLDQQKQKYKSSFNQLKALKTEIEHMQFLLEKSKVKLQNDFEVWWASQVTQTVSQQQQNMNGVRNAWKTPPLTPLQSTPNEEYKKRNGRTNIHSVTDSSTESTSRNAFLSNIKPSNSNSEKNISTDSGNLMKASIASSRSSHSEKRVGSSGIRLTGDPQTDDDIMAFMKARQELVNRSRR